MQEHHINQPDTQSKKEEKEKRDLEALEKAKERLRKAGRQFENTLITLEKFNFLDNVTKENYQQKRTEILRIPPDEVIEMSNFELESKTLLMTLKITQLTDQLTATVIQDLPKEKIKDIIQSTQQLPTIDIETATDQTIEKLNKKNKDLGNLVNTITRGNEVAHNQNVTKRNELIKRVNALQEEIAKHNNDSNILPNSIRMRKDLYNKIEKVAEKMQSHSKEYNALIDNPIKDYSFSKANNVQLNRTLKTIANMYFSALESYLADKLSSLIPVDIEDPIEKEKIEKLFPGLTYRVDQTGRPEFEFKDNKTPTLASIIESMVNCQIVSQALEDEERKNSVLLQAPSFLSPFSSRITSALREKKPIDYLHEQYQKLTKPNLYIKRLLNFTVDEDKNYIFGLNRKYFETIKEKLITIEKPTGDVDKLTDNLFAPIETRASIEADLVAIEKELAQLEKTLPAEIASAKAAELARLEELGRLAKFSREKSHEKTEIKKDPEVQTSSQPLANPETQPPPPTDVPAPVVNPTVTSPPVVNPTTAPSSPTIIKSVSSQITLDDTQVTRLRAFLIEQKKRMSLDTRFYMSNQSITEKQEKINEFLTKLVNDHSINIIKDLQENDVLNRQRKTIFGISKAELPFFSKKESTFTKALATLCDEPLPNGLSLSDLQKGVLQLSSSSVSNKKK